LLPLGDILSLLPYGGQTVFVVNEVNNEVKVVKPIV
jgi:hypothetical protein